MITRNGINIELTNDALIVEGVTIPLLRESDRALPEYERANRREELLLSIAELCAERYGLVLSEPTRSKCKMENSMNYRYFFANVC